MSRLLLQAASTAANATSSTPQSNAGPGKSGVIYTFTFIGATLIVGLTFMGLMFRYVVKYGYFRAPVTIPLQPARRQADDDSIPDLPSIKEIVVISNPDGCASVAIVRGDKVTDGRRPFVTYETTVSKRAFANFSQRCLPCAPTHSARSMSHAASASDLASMDKPSGFLSPAVDEKHDASGKYTECDGSSM